MLMIATSRAYPPKPCRTDRKKTSSARTNIKDHQTHKLAALRCAKYINIKTLTNMCRAAVNQCQTKQKTNTHSWPSLDVRSRIDSSLRGPMPNDEENILCAAIEASPHILRERFCKSSSSIAIWRTRFGVFSGLFLLHLRFRCSRFILRINYPERI